MFICPICNAIESEILVDTGNSEEFICKYCNQVLTTEDFVNEEKVRKHFE